MKENMVLGLAHIGLDAVDTKKCADFFVDHLNFKRISTEAFGNGHIELIGNGNCILEVVPAETANKAHGQVNHFAMEVKDVDEVMNYLESIGCVFEEGCPMKIDGFFGRGIKAAFFEGPEGMRVEIFQYLS